MGDLQREVDVPTKIFCKKYFADEYEYPDPTGKFLGITQSFVEDGFVLEINGDGVLLSYISHSFLDGWINYVEVVQARVVKRYREESPSELVAAYMARPFFGQDGRCHTTFRELGDDVVVLARDKQGRWWYFYFDQDVSDCSIGRFRTTDDDATVIETFERSCGESAVLPKDGISGWIA